MTLYNLLFNVYHPEKLGAIEKLRNKTVFITGANGLIGSNLINYLYNLNVNYGYNAKIIAHSLSEPVFWLPKDDHIEYYSSNLNEKIPNVEFDYLINLATYGQPKIFLANKLQTIELNTHTYIKLLALAKNNGASVLHLSSSEAYGQVPKHYRSVKEDFSGNISTFDLRSVYGESKRMSETISKVFIDEGLNIKIVRSAISYGPGVRRNDTRFINEFIKKALSHHKIEMLDDGRALRQPIFIIDALEMMLNILLSGKHVIYNVGGVDMVSVADIAHRIGALLDVPVILPKQTHSVGGLPKNLILDISRYTEEFGMPNFLNLEEGLQKNIDWLKYLQT